MLGGGRMGGGAIAVDLSYPEMRSKQVERQEAGINL